MIIISSFLSILVYINCELNYTTLKFTRSYSEPLNSNNVMEQLENNYISVPISIGNPKQELRLNLKLGLYPTYLISKNDKINLPVFYQENSSTYKSDGSLFFFEIPDIFWGTKATENFQFGNINIDSAIFCLETDYNDDNPLKVNSGVLGLDISYHYKLLLEDTGMLHQLKRNDLISSYDFTFKYTGEDEGEFIMGALPHQFDSNYKQENYFYTNTMSYNSDLYWGLKFTDVSFNNHKIETKYSSGFLSIESGIMKGPKDFFNLVSENFFNKYFESNLCLKDSLKGMSYYHCSVKDVDYSEFGELSFYVKDNLNFTFSFSHEELFYEYEGRKYFLVVYDPENTEWVLGKPFFKKYQILFNLDKKLVGIYKEDGLVSGSSSGGKGLGLWWIPITILIILAGVYIFFWIFRLKRPRMKRATELIEDYEYIPSGK